MHAVEARPSSALRPIALAGAFAAALLAFGAVGGAMVWPPGETVVPRLELGLLSDLPPGSVRTVVAEDGPARLIHVVRPESGRPYALVGRAARPRGGARVSQYGCSVPWRPDFVYRGRTGWFRDPCHGQTFDLAGNCQSPACTRALDRLRLEVRSDGELILYPDRILSAPERGWPPEGASRP